MRERGVACGLLLLLFACSSTSGGGSEARVALDAKAFGCGSFAAGRNHSRIDHLTLRSRGFSGGKGSGTLLPS